MLQIRAARMEGPAKGKRQWGMRCGAGGKGETVRGKVEAEVQTEGLGRAEFYRSLVMSDPHVCGTASFE
jgi:hypothetical protein